MSSSNPHSNTAFPGFLDGGGTFDAQTADWMFEESRMNTEGDSGSGPPDIDAPEEADTINEDVTDQDFMNEGNIEEMPIYEDASNEDFVNENVTNQKLINYEAFNQNAASEYTINEGTADEDTVNQEPADEESADEEIESDFFWYNGRWYRYTTEVSPALETLAQDVWAGRLNSVLGLHQTSVVRPVAEEVEEDDTEPHAQTETQPTFTRQDTPIPNWDEEDEDKASSQDQDQAIISRAATPVPEQGASQPSSTQIANAGPSSSRIEEADSFPGWNGITTCPYLCKALLDTEEMYIEHMRKHKGESFLCEAPGCDKVYVHLRSLRKHQRMIHGNFEHGVRVKWAES